MKLSRAQRRVYLKAKANGWVMIAGGFGGTFDDDFDVILEPLFDKRCIIERLVAKGVLIPGDGANQFVVNKETP